MLDSATCPPSHFRRKKRVVQKKRPLPPPPPIMNFQPTHASGCLRVRCWSRKPQWVPPEHMTRLLVPCGFASWNSFLECWANKWIGTVSVLGRRLNSIRPITASHSSSLQASDPRPTAATGTSSNGEMPTHEGTWLTVSLQTEHLRQAASERSGS